MRIVQLTTVHQWDDIRIYRKICRSLAAAGHDVHLVVPQPETIPDPMPDDVTAHWLPRPRNRLQRFLGSFRAMRLARKLRPDVIHFHDSELIPAAMWSRLLGRRVIYDAHESVRDDILVKTWIPWILRWPAAVVAGAIEWLGSRIMTANVAVTEYIARRFPRKRTILIQNFPLLDELLVMDRGQATSETPTFIFLGMLVDHRGPDQMIGAMRRFAGTGRAKLVLAGPIRSTELDRHVHELSADLPVSLPGNVPRDQVPGLLGAATAGLVLFHPVGGLEHAQPNKMFEYMSAGLPVIASHFDAWRTIVDGAGCGLLVDPMDPEAIGEAMQWILEHPDEAAEMGRRGRVAVEERFNWEQESRQLLDMYAAIADDRPVVA